MSDAYKELVEQLRRECIDGSDGHSPPTDLTEQLLTEMPNLVTDLTTTTTLEMAIDHLVHGQESITPDDRARLVDTARRGIRSNQRSPQPLQLILEQARVKHNLDIDQLATDLHLDPSILLTYEAGNKPLTELGAEGLAQWVLHVDIAPEDATTSLRRSLTLAASGPRFAARPSHTRDDTAAETFLEQFRTALNDLRQP